MGAPLGGFTSDEQEERVRADVIAQCIRWLDSIRHTDGWESIEHYEREAKKTMEGETLGFVIYECDDSVMLAQSRMLGEGGTVTEVIQIPKVAILERKSLLSEH